MPSIVVTGATSGMGKAISILFAQKGWHVVATGRRTERLRELAEQYPNILPLGLDVRDAQAVKSVLSSLKAPFAPVDVLVNNAGLALGLQKAADCDMDDWNTMIDTNIKGVLNCTHAVLADMVARRQGHVINIGSIAGNYPYEGGNVYSSSKAFVRFFSANLRCDLHGTHVRVTNIEPGALDSEFLQVRYKGNLDAVNNRLSGVRPLKPEDVADCVYWAATRPEHVDISRIEIMPTNQSTGSTRLFREDS